MKFKSFSSWTAACGVYLVVISCAPAADFTAAGSAPNAEPGSPIADSRSVESADYRSYVRNLQTLGFPKPTIRSIVTADAIAAFAGKRATAVAVRYRDFKYWRSNPAETGARATLAAQRGAIDEEMNGVLQQLLGADADLPDTSREWQREEWNQQLSFLTPPKREATTVILQEYAKVNQQMKELAGGLNLSEDTNVLQQILGRYQEQQTTLQQVLSSEEFKQVQMTTSWTAENLRHALVHFEPTEAEFRAMFAAWQPHDDNLSQIYANRLPDPGNAAVYAKIKEQLSAPRYEQYCASWWK